MFSIKDQILMANDLGFEDVTIPEWPEIKRDADGKPVKDENGFAIPVKDKDGNPIPGVFRVRALSAAERDKFEASMIPAKGKNNQAHLDNFRARYVALTLVDPETGDLLFKGNELVEFGKKNARPINELFEVGRKLSGMSDKDVEELGKESKNDQP